MVIKEYSLKRIARMAGICYLLGSLTSMYGQMIVWGKLINPANATETAANILSHESLFRLGFVSSFVQFHFIFFGLCSFIIFLKS